MKNFNTWMVILFTLFVAGYRVSAGPHVSMETAGQKEKHVTPVTVAEARSIAKEAFIYGFPMVEGYKTLYRQALDRGDRDFKAPFNDIGHIDPAATLLATQPVSPDPDTSYSYMWMDLRSGPMVITVPKIEKKRYFTIQLIDLYSHNFAYIGTRTVGNKGGRFLIAGPDWEGAPPSGITKVIPCETWIAYGIIRNQIFNPEDMENVRQIQQGYGLQPLSRFLGLPAPAAAPAIDWPRPFEEMTGEPAFFSYLNFMLQFIPTHPSELKLMKRLAGIGVGPGLPFHVSRLSQEMNNAVEEGIVDGWKAFMTLKTERIDTGELTSGDLFGTRESLENNYLYRMAGAAFRIFANSREEAIHSVYFTDADGNPLDAAKHRYTLRYGKGRFPPAREFWSVIIYDSRSQLSDLNPMNRYLINSTMLKTLTFGRDGSLTLYIQKEFPGTERASNWLPAPDGPFFIVNRIYVPRPEALDGRWKRPQINQVKSNSEQ